MKRWLCPSCRRDWDHVVRNFWSSGMGRLRTECNCGLAFTLERTGDDVFLLTRDDVQTRIVSGGEGLV